jgi:hypothetical protein
VQKCFTAVLFGSNGNSYTVCTVSDMCVYINILHNTETPVGQKKCKKMVAAENTACHLGQACRGFASPVPHSNPQTSQSIPVTHCYASVNRH